MSYDYLCSPTLHYHLGSSSLLFQLLGSLVAPHICQLSKWSWLICC